MVITSSGRVWINQVRFANLDRGELNRACAVQILKVLYRRHN